MLIWKKRTDNCNAHFVQDNQFCSLQQKHHLILSAKGVKIIKRSVQHRKKKLQVLVSTLWVRDSVSCHWQKGGYSEAESLEWSLTSGYRDSQWARRGAACCDSRALVLAPGSPGRSVSEQPPDEPPPEHEINFSKYFSLGQNTRPQATSMVTVTPMQSFHPSEHWFCRLEPYFRWKQNLNTRLPAHQIAYTFEAHLNTPLFNI